MLATARSLLDAGPTELERLFDRNEPIVVHIAEPLPHRLGDRVAPEDAQVHIRILVAELALGTRERRDATGLHEPGVVEAGGTTRREVHPHRLRGHRAELTG